MRIKLNDERKSQIPAALIGFYDSEYDEELSDYRAKTIVDFMLHQVGPSQYNQAISDACKYMAEKIQDLNTEYYAPDDG